MKKDKKIIEYVGQLKDIKLSDSSRTRMQEQLLEHARFHPVTEGVRVGQDSRSIKRVPQRTSLFTFLTQPKSMTAAIIAIALIVGGGTSYAAQGAVPGDALYVVKTEVNENVQNALAFSDEAEARLQARLTQERLKEAEVLATRGELTAEVAADISTRVKTHADKVQEYSDKVQAQGDYQTAATVRANLEGSFQAYVDILTEANTTVAGNDGASLVSDIKTYMQTTAQAQTNATATIEASATVKPTAKAMLEQADSAIAGIKEQLVEAKSDFSAQTQTQIEVRLLEAMDVQEKAKVSFKNEVYAQAYAGAQKAIKLASEAKARINSALRVDLESTSDATIDTGLLDVNIGSDTETKPEAGSQTGVDADNSAQKDVKASSSVDSDSDDDTSVEIEVEATTDSAADTGLLEVKGKSKTSASGGLSL